MKNLAYLEDTPLIAYRLKLATEYFQQPYVPCLPKDFLERVRRSVDEASIDAPPMPVREQTPAKMSNGGHASGRITVWRRGDPVGAELWYVSASSGKRCFIHDSYVAILTLAPESGRTRWRCNGARFTARMGDVQLLAPGDVHVTDEVSGPLTTLFVWWSADALEACAKENAHPWPLSFEHPQTADSQLVNSIKQLFLALEDQNESYAQHWYTKCTKRLFELGTAAKFSVASRCERLVSDARRWLAEDPVRRNTLDEFVKRIDSTKGWLLRRFEGVLGVTVSQYQMMNRVRLACSKLRSGESPRRVARRFGFRNVAHLKHCTLQLTGIAPAEWRKMELDPRPSIALQSTNISRVA